MLPLVLTGLLIVGSVAIATGWGLRTPGMYFFGVVTCTTCAVSAPRRGLVVSLAAAALVIALALAEWTGLVPTHGDATSAPLISRTLVQLAAIVTGSGAGMLLSRLYQAHLREATDRELRFRRLLGIAAEGYWETDAHLRVHLISRRNQAAEFVPVPLPQPVLAWEVPQLVADAAALDRLRECMVAGEPVRDLPMCWERSDGTKRFLLISGEPQHGAGGRFLGYWGVARDVTTEHLARAALIDTETRYHDLFLRTPTPMLLHRRGVVLDANLAAAAIFGGGSPARLVGMPTSLFYRPEDEDRLAERRALLRRLPSGEALPLSSFEMRTLDGRPLHVRATAVRADLGGRSAMLSIYIDETAQRSAAQAEQRSEMLLRQVVSMSPDVIVLIAMNTRQFEMVNDSFTRLTGYAAAEVLGRTPLEIGLWHSQEDRARLITAIRASSGVVHEIAMHFRHREGHRLHMLVSATTFVREGATYLVLNARDMSEATRQRLEREAIMANASVGLAQTRQRRFVMVNPRFEQMYGWPPGHLMGLSADVVWARQDEFDQLGTQIGAALRAGEQVDIERMARRQDGSEFLARLRAKAVDPQHPSSGGTIWIAEDVTAQRQAEAELARARDAAEAANRAKSTFLANTSHEIRTPLNGLVGLARLARQPNVPPDRLQRYLAQIADSAETLSMIISDILDLSKIEAGRLELESAPFSLTELLQSLHHAYASLADSRDLNFTMDLDDAVPDQVVGDALRVRQILSNYLHNALKFTPEGGVSLVVRALPGDWVRFEVRDTGLGIDEATQARLFKPFTQADESITRRFGGTGLGLSICQQLAELMHGHVGLQSQACQGSCFHVELPLAPVQADFAASGHSTMDSDMLAGSRVLLVEDNAVNMMIGLAMLEQWGVTAVPAEDGSSAIAKIEAAVLDGQPFDAVLMDVQMPGMSGHEATRRLRQRWPSDRLPIIALTAAALVSEREQALASGMNDFVTKPIEPNRLRQALLRAMAQEA
jgi:PAS domain S-box-containing protein